MKNCLNLFCDAVCATSAFNLKLCHLQKRQHIFRKGRSSSSETRAKPGMSPTVLATLQTKDSHTPGQLFVSLNHCLTVFDSCFPWLPELTTLTSSTNPVTCTPIPESFNKTWSPPQLPPGSVTSPTTCSTNSCSFYKTWLKYQLLPGIVTYPAT